jgi:hypothetical protein
MIVARGLGKSSPYTKVLASFGLGGGTIVTQPLVEFLPPGGPSPRRLRDEQIIIEVVRQFLSKL